MRDGAFTLPRTPEICLDLNNFLFSNFQLLNFAYVVGFLGIVLQRIARGPFSQKDPFHTSIWGVPDNNCPSTLVPVL